MSVQSAQKSPITPANLNTLSGWWKRFQQRRERLRVRSLSVTRFRLTREGYHLVFIVAFILVGAVLRDISLLILLASAMIGLLVLQWRFCLRTLSKLRVSRHLIERIGVDKTMICRLTIRNQKKWLPAWLIAAEDNIELVQPALHASLKARTILAEIAPTAESSGDYTITFRQRGRYRIGPCQLSTRFPMGLGIGYRTLEVIDHVTVHPKLGELLPEFDSLLHNSRVGQHQTAAHVGYHEAEFFGLRPWASGDSKRWIHWRTTARLGELAVRQFDRLEQRQSCILLDLYSPKELEARFPESASEKAISFLATIVNKVVVAQSQELAVGIAGDSSTAICEIQSPVSANAMLDRLAVISCSKQPDLAETLAQLTTTLIANPHLIVISTRPSKSDELLRSFEDLAGEKSSTALHITWLNASAGDLERYITWTSKRSSNYVAS